MKKTLYLLILALFAMGLHSCEKYVFAPSTFQDVSFSEDIQPIFNNKCTKCHGTRNPVLLDGQAYDNLVNGNYVDIDNPEESKIYRKLVSGHGDAIPDDAEKVKVWIAEGANDN